jgi:GNAT superfamily N-acetyltransferase
MVCEMTIRQSRPGDVRFIAALHANSWRAAYRGILSDEFLDGPLDENRLALWSTRCSDITRQDQHIIVDEDQGDIRGFACAFLDADPHWGSLLDNLHVVPDLKGRGLGRQLIGAIAAAVIQNASNPTLHLWAYEQNIGARRFYEHLGGVVTGCEEEPALDGTRVNAVRYFWRDLSGLAPAIRCPRI